MYWRWFNDKERMHIVDWFSDVQKCMLGFDPLWNWRKSELMKECAKERNVNSAQARIMLHKRSKQSGFTKEPGCGTGLGMHPNNDKRLQYCEALGWNIAEVFSHFRVWRSFFRLRLCPSTNLFCFWSKLRTLSSSLGIRE